MGVVLVRWWLVGAGVGSRLVARYLGVPWLVLEEGGVWGAVGEMGMVEGSVWLAVGGGPGVGSVWSD